MAFWKQLCLSVVLLVACLGIWVYVSPGAGRTLVGMGVPQGLVGLISPQPAEGSAQAGGAGEGAGQARRPGGGGPTLIATEAVSMGVVNDRLSAIGDGEAIQAVTVMPQATGTVEEILVSSGERVTKGQVVAKLDRDEQVILRDQAQVALRSAREKSESYSNLRSFSRLDVLDAQIAAENAELQLATAELNLKRRDIIAPIDGVIGIVAISLGDNVTTSSSVVTLDNRQELLVDFWAPERFVTAVKPGMPVQAASVSRPGETFEGTIEAVDNRVEPASRTIRIRARIDNFEDRLRAGMSFNVTMRFPGETYPGVNPLAVQWDAEGSFVWQVVDDKSVKTRVKIIQRNSDTVLVDAGLKEGDMVAVEGLQRVREGGAVQIAGQAPEQVAGAVAGTPQP